MNLLSVDPSWVSSGVGTVEEIHVLDPVLEKSIAVLVAEGVCKELASGVKELRVDGRARAVFVNGRLAVLELRCAHGWLKLGYRTCANELYVSWGWLHILRDLTSYCIDVDEEVWRAVEELVQRISLLCASGSA